MAYELGAGLGIALFGLILTALQRLYCAAVWPEWRHGAAGGVIDWRGGESVPGAARRVAQALMAAAKTAFIQAHSLVLATAGVLLLLLAAGIWQPPPWRNRSRRYSCATDPSPRAVAGREPSFNAAALTVAAGTRHSGRPPPDRATARVPPASTSLPRSAGRRGHSPACAPGRSLHVNRTNRTGYAECSE